MPLFKFRAIDAKGRITSGSSTAADRRTLTGILKEQGLFLMEAETTQEPQAPASTSHPVLLARSSDKVPLDAVTIFTTELAIMVRTALPILESLINLAEQQKNPVLKAVLFEITRTVRGGQPMSVAFARYPKIFDEVYISMLSAGEAGGNMHLMLDRIAAYLNFQRGMKAKIQAALLYPSIVVLTAGAIVAFLVLFILPTYAEVFRQFELTMPFPTRLLIGFSDNIRAWWWLYVVSAMVAWGYFTRWISDPLHVKTMDSLALSLPVVGPLVQSIVMTRVLRTLAALVSSGVPILKSLDLAKNSAGNVVFHEILGQVYRNASEGKGLASALTASRHIPPQVANMIANAEKTGTLPEVLNKISDYYETETDGAFRNLFSILEPILVVILGLMVGGIAIGVLLPIFNLGEGLK